MPEAILGSHQLPAPVANRSIQVRFQCVHYKPSSFNYDFVSLESVQTTLNALMVRLPPLVIRLARQSGQKDERYAHLLSGPIAFPESEPSPRPVAATVDRIGRLQEATIELQQQIDDLRSQFEQLRKQFSSVPDTPLTRT
jgi:uncharacterized protein YceH (UPF0502 family)